MLANRAQRGFRHLRIGRIGIAGHLGTSFLAVGVLAAIANVIVEQGVSIVEITRVASAPAAMEIEDRYIDPPSRFTSPIPSVDGERAAFSDAVDQYDSAIRLRAQIPNPENDGRVTATNRALRAAAVSVKERIGAGTPPDLERAVNAYRESGAHLLALADQRRTTIETYGVHLESMDDRLNLSVDKSWKILGRVVARQTLLRLRREHDQLQNAFHLLSAIDSVNASAVESLIQKETAFGLTLAEHERGFVRAEGREWVDGIKSELNQLVSLREALVNEWHQLDVAEADFIESRSRAREAIQTVFELAQQTADLHVSVSSPFFGPPILDQTPFVGPLLVDAHPTNPAPQPETRISRQETDSAKQLLVAGLTGGVLIIVLVISIGTVRSIVVPIRRLLRATTELGKFGTHEPVPRGGIKELDTLAQSFNQMAEELVAARRRAGEHQQQLEQRVAERTHQLQELAECDPLTGLPNRRHLLVLLENALETARRDGQLVAVFFLDLDNFKNVNDSMGHGFGDEVLKAVSKRLAEAARGMGFAARLGGDEFTVVLTGTRNIERVRHAGLQVIAAFHHPLSVGNRDLMISVSAGASIYPDHEDTAEGLLKAADAALFRAKALGRSQLSVYTPELLAEAAAKFTTEQGLRRSAERGEFELVFQPEICADTLQTELVEALIRWRMPDGKLASPGEFLAVAEESGLITEISDWVLRSAIETAAHWHHGEWPEARVAINVSARQLLDHRFVDNVQALLQKFELPERCIEIELTETVLQTGLATIDTLHRLHAAEIAIALDDFGTGYSSLASLEKLPFTRIKLDRSLVDDIATSARSAAIARAIIRLCHDLKLHVTAEGVERTEQLEILMRHRPISLQGYLLSKPVPARDLISTLDRLADDVQVSLAMAGNSHGPEEIAFTHGVPAAAAYGRAK